MSVLAKDLAEDLDYHSALTGALTLEEIEELIDQKLSGVRGGLLKILWDSMGKGFGDKVLNERLKSIDTIAVQLCESLAVPSPTKKIDNVPETKEQVMETNQKILCEAIEYLEDDTANEPDKLKKTVIKALTAIQVELKDIRRSYEQ